MPINIHSLVLRFKNGHVRETTPFLLTLFELVLEMKPEVVFEIGVHNGFSTNTILSALENNKKGKLYAIDKLDFSNNIAEDLKPYCEFMVADSKEFYKTWDSKEIDILHIDGDHSYTMCKSDYENYYPFVKPGGYILIHDVIQWKGVTKFWDEITDKKIFLPWYDGMAIIQKNGLEPKDVAATRPNLAG
jgi:predicted O-methyltransferase YrrM